MRNVLIVFLACAACGGKDDSGGKPSATPAPASPSPAPSPSQSQPSSPGAPATPPASGSTMSCGKLISKALVDKYLVGLELTEKSFGPEKTSCDYKRKQPFALANVHFECKQAVYDAMAMTIDMMTKGKTMGIQGTKVDGVGKGAVSLMEGQIAFWATNAHCMVTLTTHGDAPAAKDTQAFAKDLDASLSPSSL
jgi:hypothetical protein